jgi:N-acetylneuraminate synthase
MEINGRRLGPGEPVYIAAEIAANHGGDLELALYQTLLAKDAGADAVKFQVRTFPESIPEDQRDVMKSTPWGELSYLDYRKRLEFGKLQYEAIDAHCRSIGIDWFVSVWSEQAVDFMEQFDPICYKIGSPSLTDDVLLRRVAATERPVILSTGGSRQEQVAAASVTLASTNDLLVCQCTSSYPCDPAEVNLNYLAKLRLTYLDVGYSGHELGTAISIAAVALGAVYVERHFTSSHELWGSDQALSLEPQEFAEMVKGIREVEQALGDGIKRVYDSEQDSLKKLRRVNATRQGIQEEAKAAH